MLRQASSLSWSLTVLSLSKQLASALELNPIAPPPSSGSELTVMWKDMGNDPEFIDLAITCDGEGGPVTVASLTQQLVKRDSSTFQSLDYGSTPNTPSTILLTGEGLMGGLDPFKTESPQKISSTTFRLESASKFIGNIQCNDGHQNFDFYIKGSITVGVELIVRIFTGNKLAPTEEAPCSWLVGSSSETKLSLTSTASLTSTRAPIMTSTRSDTTTPASSETAYASGSQVVTSSLTLPTPTPPNTILSSTSLQNGSDSAPTKGIKKTATGAIVGGVLGGVLGLVVIAAVLLFYRRKQRNTSELNLLRTARDTTASPSPSLHNEWLTKVDAAMNEAAKQTERARSRTESRLRGSDLGHYSASGFQSPDTMTERTQYGPQSRVLSPISPPVPAIYRGEEHLEVTGYPETNRSVESESEESGGIQLKPGEGPWDEDFEVLASTRTPSHNSHDTDDTEEREKRREELFAQMRRVLDNDSINRVDEDSEESGFYRPTGSVEET
ncbi:hypothetical protein DXG01_013375 [Tephrocybe rancida]|nr:hypothetical protein DXG01_013375 [Tephrocybe rancida]